MANGRYKGATPEERLAIDTLLDGDMIQVRHRIGQDGDSDKGVSKAVLQGMPLAVCENLPTVASKYAVLQNCPDFTLVAGRNVLVYFKYGNTAENPTLNVAGTGDIPMDSTVGLPSWKAETWQMFTYATAVVNGVEKNNWVLIQGAIEREAKNITSYLLDGSFFPRILGNGGYDSMTGIESDDYFYCLGYYDKKENIKWKVKEDNGKIFIKSNFGFYPFVSHHYYRAKFDDMLDYNYDNVPLVCLYPQIFTKQTALSLGIQPYEEGELKLFKFFEHNGLIVVKIGNEYAKSTDNGASWTKINGPQDDDVTCVFYNTTNYNIYFRGRYYTSCGTTNSSGSFTPEPEPSSLYVDVEMSQWLHLGAGIDSEGHIRAGFSGYVSSLSDYENGIPIKTAVVTGGAEADKWATYPVDDNGNVYLKIAKILGVQLDSEKTVTFQLNEEDIECSKVLVDYYNKTLCICAVCDNKLLYGTLPESELTSSTIKVELKPVYDYEQKVSSDMTFKVNSSKMSFSMIGNKPFICTAKKGDTKLERFVIFEDTSDHKLLACSCGFVDFDYDDNWNNKYEYDGINMNLYKMCPCLDYLDYSNYIREHKYDEFTEQKSEVIPISPPEEQYASAGDDCDCYVRLV